MFKKLFVIGMAMVGSIFAGEFKIHDFELNHADGIYKRGEEIVVTGTLLNADKPAQEYKLRAITRWESLKDVATQEFPCDGKPFRVTFKSDKPGWVYFVFQVIDSNGAEVVDPSPKNPQGKRKLVAEIGAMIAPEEIRAADECPVDFDEFWKNERTKLDKVPMNPRLEKINSGREGIDLFTVKLDNHGNLLQCSYLENPRDGKAWWAAVYGVAQSRTRLKRPPTLKPPYLRENQAGSRQLPEWEGGTLTSSPTWGLNQ